MTTSTDTSQQEALRALRRSKSEYEQRSGHARRERRAAVEHRAQAVRDAAAAGLTYAQIGRVLGIRRARIAQVRTPPPSSEPAAVMRSDGAPLRRVVDREHQTPRPVEVDVLDCGHTVPASAPSTPRRRCPECLAETQRDHDAATLQSAD